MNVHIDRCPPNGRYLTPYSWHNGGEGFVHPTADFMEVLWCEDERQPLPPNGGFVEGFHNWSVMSSITGPSLGSELSRTILPMEVVMVSRYTSPMVFILHYPA